MRCAEIQPDSSDLPSNICQPVCRIKRVEEPRRFDSRGYSKEAVLRPHQKLLTKVLVLGAEINIDPQGIFRCESGNRSILAGIEQTVVEQQAAGTPNGPTVRRRIGGKAGHFHSWLPARLGSASGSGRTAHRWNRRRLCPCERPAVTNRRMVRGDRG